MGDSNSFYLGLYNTNRINNPLRPTFPAPQDASTDCYIQNRIQTPVGQDVCMETVPYGPASVKHLYEGPGYYPTQKIQRPVDTLYGHDFSQVVDSGSGTGKRISYQFKMYPFTHLDVREREHYADEILPYPDWASWTKHPIRSENTLNSKLQNHPHINPN